MLTRWALFGALAIAGCGDDERSATRSEDAGSGGAPSGAGAGGGGGAAGGVSGAGGIVGAGGTSASTPPAQCSSVEDWDPAWVSLEDELLAELNRQRAGAGGCPLPEGGALGPFMVDAALRCAARLHAMDMSVRGYFDTMSPDGGTFSDRLAAAGYTATGPRAENIGMGQTPAALATESTVCNNVMNPAFTKIGIGYYAGEGGAGYWTIDFGR